MMTLVQFDFEYHGPFGDEMATTMGDLARSIVEEPGLLWKIWTENAETREAGGIYLFTDESSALAYIRKHTERLRTLGIERVNAKRFAVNQPLSWITRGPVPD